MQLKTHLIKPLTMLAAFFSAMVFTFTVACAAPAQQAYLKASNTEGNDYFAHSLAVSGDTVVVGAPIKDNRAGAAYVFVRAGTNWTQQAYLKASNAEADDYFGYSVSVSGDTVVVGAYGESSNATGVNGNPSDNGTLYSGAAYVFVRNGTNWAQQAYLKASNPDPDDTFGVRVAVSGDTVVVGAYLEASSATGVNGNQSDNSAYLAGAAYVFVRTGTNWSQQAYLKASNTGAEDWFGWSVAVSGDTAVVGASSEDSNATGVNGNQSDNSASSAGAAYVFVRTGTNWHQQAYLKASNTDSNDYFADSVAVSGDTVVIGAPVKDRAGAAYIFVRNGTNWTQQAYLKASNTDSNDYFAHSVAVSGDTVVVGAPSDAISAFHNTNLNSGAAYAFVRSGANWSQQAYLKASNTEAGDVFGWSVAVSGDTLAIGAPFEDSSATGVNVGIGPRLVIAPDASGGYFIRVGNQNDNSASLAGAAYIFTVTGAPNVAYRLQRAPSVNGPWETIAELTAPASGFLEFHDTTPLLGQAFYRTVQP